MADTERAAETMPMPSALSRIPESRIVDLDVREELRHGGEPFRRIMVAREEVPDGGVLRLRAIFEPVPLYGVMARHGYAHWTERFAGDDWRVWFYPESAAAADSGADRDDDAPTEGSAESATDAGPGPDAGDDAAESDDVVVLDVRGMEPPEPMTATLEALETLPEGKTLLQINVRVPRFLLPRLEERGWSWEIREQEGGPVRVVIRHADG